MNTILLTLLGVVTITTILFLFLLFKLSLEDADFWLKVMSGVLAAFTFLAGAAALVTGTVSGNRQAERIETLEKSTAEAKREQADAERKLREAFSPREIADQAAMTGSLGSFSGTKFILLSLADAETSRTAEQIYAVLGDAKWQLVHAGKTLDDSRFRDDVLVQTDLSNKQALDAANALVAQLNSNNIKAVYIPSNELDNQMYDLTPNTVLVKVGFKSSDPSPNKTENKEGIQMRSNRRKF